MLVLGSGFRGRRMKVKRISFLAKCLLLSVFADFLLSCSDSNIGKELHDDISQGLLVYSDEPSGSENSVYVQYELDSQVPASRLISDCMTLSLKPGYEIKSLKYYKNLTENITDAPSYVILNDDDTFSLMTIKPCADSFYVYESDKISYTLVFDANGGSGTAPASITAEYDEVFTLPGNTFTRAGYVFKCWKINGISYYSGFVSKLASRANVTVTAYAIWLPKISYDSLPGGVTAALIDDGSGGVSGVTFTSSYASNVWICNGNKSETSSFTINCSSYSAGSYTVFLFVSGKAAPSSFKVTIN